LSMDQSFVQIKHKRYLPNLRQRKIYRSRHIFRNRYMRKHLKDRNWVF
jgi:hypothetical protein